jgi:hypothetical protein
MCKTVRCGVYDEGLYDGLYDEGLCDDGLYDEGMCDEGLYDEGLLMNEHQSRQFSKIKTN